MAYSEGSVLLAWIAYEDGTGVKQRPVIVLKAIPDLDRYVIAECYSDKDHYSKSFGTLVKCGTELHNEMGLDVDTFITSSVKAIFGKMIIKLLGHYKHIEQLKIKLRTK